MSGRRFFLFALPFFFLVPRETPESEMPNSKNCYWLVTTVLALVGCSQQVKPGAVGLDPPTVAAAILQEFDTDGSGGLSKTELKASRSLEALSENEMAPLDADGDSQVTPSELETKIQAFVDVNRVTCRCQVTYRGAPMPDAQVRFIPEPSMGDTLSEATGVTDQSGIAEVEDGGEFGGMVSGLYRVEITHPQVELNAKYNTATTLGAAVDGTNPYAAPIAFRLR